MLLLQFRNSNSSINVLPGYIKDKIAMKVDKESRLKRKKVIVFPYGQMTWMRCHAFSG